MKYNQSRFFCQAIGAPSAKIRFCLPGILDKEKKESYAFSVIDITSLAKDGLSAQS